MWISYLVLQIRCETTCVGHPIMYCGITHMIVHVFFHEPHISACIYPWYKLLDCSQERLQELPSLPGLEEPSTSELVPSHSLPGLEYEQQIVQHPNAQVARSILPLVCIYVVFSLGQAWRTCFPSVVYVGCDVVTDLPSPFWEREVEAMERKSQDMVAQVF